MMLGLVIIKVFCNFGRLRLGLIKLFFFDFY